MEATAIVPAKMKVAWSGLVGGGYGGGERERQLDSKCVSKEERPNSYFGCREIREQETSKYLNLSNGSG